MQRTTWTLALGVMICVTLPASAEIIRGTMLVHGAEMS